MNFQRGILKLLFFALLKVMPIIHGNWHDFYSLALNFDNGDPMFCVEILFSVFKSGLLTNPAQGQFISFDQIIQVNYIFL